MAAPSTTLAGSKVNLLTLSFPGKIEKAFQEDYFQKSLRHVRIALVLGMVFYGIFGILDAWIVSVVKQKLWLIRYAIICPFILGVFLFSYSGYFKRYMQLSIASVVLLSGLGIIAMILIAGYPANYLYYAGLLLVFIYGYTFFKLRFVWATVAGLMIVIAYEVAAVWLSETPIHVLANNNFFFLSGNVIGMFACYSIELYSRKDFMQARLLEAEREKVDVANRELERRVEDRTVQLVKANEELKQEVGERKRAEEALRESEERYRSLVQNVPIAVYRTTPGPKGKFLMANPTLLKMFGLQSEEELKKVSVADLYMNPKDRKVFSDNLLTQANVDGVELPLRKKDGTSFWASVKARVVYDQNKKGPYFDCTIMDITARKHAEEEKERLEGQLRQAQKIEAIGTLAGGIAHDFNNILSAVIGYTQISLDDVEKGTTLETNLQEVLKAGRRARDLVKQILTFSRQTEQERKPLEITPIVKEALKLLRASLPSSIEIHQDIGTDLGTVLADPTQIHQVLMNLCTNAAHAMGERGGIVEVNLANVELGPDFTSRHPQVSPGRYLQLTVSDTGHGIDPPIIERIFDPFFTTKERGEGTGMGLAVVHGIVKSYGGTISVYSEPGKGSTFHVYFPLIEGQVEAEAGVGEPIPTGNERILFVDDEQTIVDVGKQILERLGYQVVTRTSSIEGLELFRAQPDKFDLVITDMTMPHMGGGELAEELMRIRPDIRVILCSGYSEKITEAKAKATDIRAFVGKPILKRDIAKTVRRVLDEIR